MDRRWWWRLAVAAVVVAFFVLIGRAAILAFKSDNRRLRNVGSPCTLCLPRLARGEGPASPC